MARKLFGKSVKGATHVRNGQPLQDSFRIEEISPNMTILAVADGHGSEKSPKSKNGSQIAVNTFCKVLRSYVENYSTDEDSLITFLNREGDTKIAKEICEEWQRRVRESYYKSKERKSVPDVGENDWDSVYRLYGTTLIGLLVADNFMFAFQIGDGDIAIVEDGSVTPVVEAEKILGTETHSLCKKNAWRNAVTAIRRKNADEDTPYLYMLTTDGFVNSYVSEAEYQRSCKDYLAMIKEYGFERVCSNVESWLNETSSLGCGDDITLVMAYFYEEDNG